MLGEWPDDRKVWIEKRLEELAQTFAVVLAGKTCHAEPQSRGEIGKRLPTSSSPTSNAR